MGYCISVCIEKGGVGKTVTVCNLAALMAQDGKRVLVVDMDAQGNCTYTLTGARVTDNTFDRAGVYDMFRAYGISGTQNYISRTQFDNIDIIPANGNTPMAAKQLQILEQSESTSINMFLAMCLAQVAGEYDYILIDCPPSLGFLTINALAAADTMADYLGRALALIANVVDPEMFLIGGGASASADVYLDKVREHFKQ